MSTPILFSVPLAKTEFNLRPNGSREQYLFAHMPSILGIVIWGTDNLPFRIRQLKAYPKKGETMSDVSPDTYDSVKYPWQSPVLEALRDFNADQLLEKIAITEGAIAKRLVELRGAAEQEETRALHDAQNTLTVLKGQY
jgi:hypothetical protein